MSSYQSKSPADLRKLAMDIANGHVFTSEHVSESQSNLLPMIFMPLTFMGEAQLQAWKDDDITLVYEYISKAGPRSINGCPAFFSCAVLDKQDAARVWELVREFDVKAKAFLDPSTMSPKVKIDPNQTVLFKDREDSTEK